MRKKPTHLPTHLTTNKICTLLFLGLAKCLLLLFQYDSISIASKTCKHMALVVLYTITLTIYE